MSNINCLHIAALLSGTEPREPVWLPRAREIWPLICLLRYLTNTTEHSLWREYHEAGMHSNYQLKHADHRKTIWQQCVRQPWTTPQIRKDKMLYYLYMYLYSYTKSRARIYLKSFNFWTKWTYRLVYTLHVYTLLKVFLITLVFFFVSLFKFTVMRIP